MARSSVVASVRNARSSARISTRAAAVSWAICSSNSTPRLNVNSGQGGALRGDRQPDPLALPRVRQEYKIAVGSFLEDFSDNQFT